jgi:hypothetical protein
MTRKLIVISSVFIILIVVIVSIIVSNNSNTQDEPTILPAPIMVTPEPEPLITEANVELWTPSHVDAPSIPIRFTYTSNVSSSCNVELEYKAEGTTDYRKATISGNASFSCPTGESESTIIWDKKQDGIEAGIVIDLQLTVTDQDAFKASFELTSLQLESRMTIRNHIDNYLIYYGAWTEALIDQARQSYQLIILETRSGITPRQIAQLRGGKDPHNAKDDLLVLAYVSIGEDLRTAGMTSEQMKLDPRFVLDGTGPSTDPRPGAPFPQGHALPDDIDLKGKPTNGGFAPFYLNDNFVTFGTIGSAGAPDFNTNFNAAFVNPGHPEWFNVLVGMKLQTDHVSGIHELLSNDAIGFGCDGLFLDTLDTAAPNSYTNGSSSNQGQFEWVAPGIKQLISKIRDAYPNQFLLANRGAFFYNPDLPAYTVTLRGLIDFVLFESYRLDSSASQWFNEATFYDNKYNYAQKLLAEADRADGFRVLSLGYAEGPDGELAKKALQGEPNKTSEILLADVQEANGYGMIHYLSNAQLTEINKFAIEHQDRLPNGPEWGSTVTPPFGQSFNEPREGIQNVIVRNKQVFVQWDVAHAQVRPISYLLYAREDQDFDPLVSLDTQGALAIPLQLNVPPDYAGLGDRTKRYPYEFKVEGLTSGKTYYLLIRSQASGLFDDNARTMKIKIP